MSNEQWKQPQGGNTEIRKRKNHYHHKKTGYKRAEEKAAFIKEEAREEGKSLANGGYNSFSRENRMKEHRASKDNNNNNKATFHKKNTQKTDSFIKNEGRREARFEREKNMGYIPDTDKQAIKQFVLGTYEEDAKNYVFSFDAGTYRIIEKVGNGEHTTEKELLNSRDKYASYQNWNAIKRPKNKRANKEELQEK